MLDVGHNVTLCLLHDKMWPDTLLFCLFFLFCILFLCHSFILHRSESSTRQILAPYDGQCWWGLNLRTHECELPALPLCYSVARCYVTKCHMTQYYVFPKPSSCVISVRHPQNKGCNYSLDIINHTQSNKLVSLAAFKLMLCSFVR